MNESPNRPLLIVLIAGIGDLVMASKAMRAIRNGFPDRKIHLLTSTEAAPLARNYTFLDEVIPFPIRELRKKKSFLVDIWRLLLNLRKTEFDVVVNLYQVSSITGAIKMGLLFMMLRAGRKIGHDKNGFGLFVDIKVPSNKYTSLHIVNAINEVAVLAGGKPDDKGIEVYWDKTCEDKWRSLCETGTKGERQLLVGINPGGDRANRRWDVANYAVVAGRIAEQYGARIILFGGPGEENIAESIQQRVKQEVVNLAGKLTLNELTYIISRLDLLITNDSGPMHIAAAVSTPQVAVFGPEDPQRLRPYTSPETYRIVSKTLDCRPCGTDECDHVSCLRNITVEEVFEAAKTLLKAQEK